MSAKARVPALAAGLIAGALLASPAMAQVSPAPAVPATPPTPAQITAFSRAVGLNETCTKGFIAVNNNALPSSLSVLTQFTMTAPAADLCSPGAIASAVNNIPAPTDAQIASYSQTVGVNQTCIHAFVLHDNSLPQNMSALNQFQQAAPTSDLCTQAAVAGAQIGAAAQ